MLTYFCAECQERHPVTDIAFDLFDICTQTMKTVMNETIRPAVQSDEPLLSRIDKITSFMNEDPRFRTNLQFTREHLLPQITDKQVNGNSVVGTFELDFQWVIDAYSRCGREKEDSESATSTREPIARIEQIPAALRNTVMFSMDMDFTFEKPFVPGGSSGSSVLVPGQIGPGRPNHENRYTETCTKRVCSKCGKSISTAVGRAPEIVIALAGSPRAGKTSCITAIASALKSNRYSSMGISMVTPTNDASWKRMEDEIQKFDKGEIITKTPKGITEVPSYSYLLRLGDESLRVLTFVDMPGEYWNQGESQEDSQFSSSQSAGIQTGLDSEFFTKYAGTYQNIDCIWLFISKLAIQQVDLNTSAYGTDEFKKNQARLINQTSDSSDTILGSSYAYLGSTLGELKNYLVNHHARSGGMPPVAVILTKSETMVDEKSSQEANMIRHFNLFPLGPSNAPFTNVPMENRKELNSVIGRRNDDGTRYLLEKEFYDRNQQVRSFILHNNSGMLSAIEDNCPDRFYIAMAAYGHPAINPDKRAKDIENTENVIQRKLDLYDQIQNHAGQFSAWAYMDKTAVQEELNNAVQTARNASKLESENAKYYENQAVHLPEQDEQEAAKREAAILRQKAEKLLAQADDLSMILSSGGDEKSAILRDRARRANNEAARILDEVNKHKAYCEMLKRSNPPTPYHEMYPLLWALSITSNYTIQHNCKWYSRGLVSRLLNLGSSNPPTVSPVYTNFHYNEAPATKKHLSEDMMDRNAMLSSLRSNLLRNPDKQIYTSTELDHPKRS